MKHRLDVALVGHNLTTTRSQAASYIKLGLVSVNKHIINQSSYMVDDHDKLTINLSQQYVSRAGLKLSYASIKLGIYYKNKIVLDVGSSTGGFTDYALKNHAKKVIAVDVGKEQLHSSLRLDPKVELYEQTDIREIRNLSSPIDIVLIDVSFISLRLVLPKIFDLVGQDTEIIAMFKPQFEGGLETKHKGVVKNDKIRRRLVHDFEIWIKQNNFIIISQSDSQVLGSKGNKERFYYLKKSK